MNKSLKDVLFLKEPAKPLKHMWILNLDIPPDFFPAFYLAQNKETPDQISLVYC